MSVEDEIRDEEVFACIVLKKNSLSDEATAKGIVDHCLSRLAYYKSPGWIRFMAELPVTGTQKVLKGKIFDGDEDPRAMPSIFDFRTLKVR